MRNTKRSASALFLLLPLLVAGCGGDEPADDGPDAVVEAFYEELNQGNYTEAMAMYSSDAMEALEGGDPAQTGFADWAERETKNGTMERVEIVDVAAPENTDSATVDYRVVYEDGTTQTRTVTLVREGGGWKMDLVG